MREREQYAAANAAGRHRRSSSISSSSSHHRHQKRPGPIKVLKKRWRKFLTIFRAFRTPSPSRGGAPAGHDSFGGCLPSAASSSSAASIANEVASPPPVPGRLLSLSRSAGEAEEAVAASAEPLPPPPPVTVVEAPAPSSPSSSSSSNAAAEPESDAEDAEVAAVTRSLTADSLSRPELITPPPEIMITLEDGFAYDAFTIERAHVLFPRRAEAAAAEPTLDRRRRVRRRSDVAAEAAAAPPPPVAIAEETEAAQAAGSDSLARPAVEATAEFTEPAPYVAPPHAAAAMAEPASLPPVPDPSSWHEPVDGTLARATEAAAAADAELSASFTDLPALPASDVEYDESDEDEEDGAPPAIKITLDDGFAYDAFTIERAHVVFPRRAEAAATLDRRRRVRRRSDVGRESESTAQTAE
ncbi:hypothetical protein H9P43_006244 [Blastocladiella emersonii ATCC 22665]|nr:hypothetical protein H9P43_006244 [Blastocladiella emersonii ATCC 22665]